MSASKLKQAPAPSRASRPVVVPKPAPTAETMLSSASAARVNTDHLKTWPSKTEVGVILGVTDKTVERYVKRRHLRQQLLKTPGRKARPVYNPEDVEALRLKMDREAAMAAQDSELFLEARQEAPKPPAEGGPLELVASGAGQGGAGQQGAMALMARLTGMGEGISAAADSLNAVAGELAAFLKGQAESASARAGAEAVAQKLVLTLAEAESLGFPRRTLRRGLKSGALANLGTVARPRFARAQLEDLWRGDAVAPKEGKPDADQ